MTKQGGMQLASQNSVKALLKQDAYQNRFKEVLKDRAPQFCSSLVSLAQQPHLAKCDPNTVIAAAMVAASLDLAIVPTFGFAYVVPYRGKAQFQIGYKGLVQLAQRTGKYKHINAFLVYDGDTLDFNPVTSEIQLTRGEGANRPVKGYGAFMSLVSGFEHAIYWTKQEVEEHALRYSEGYQAFKAGKIRSNPWDSHFNEMALKTVLKRLLVGWGPLSIWMEKAIQTDGGVLRDTEKGTQPMFEDAIEAEEGESDEQPKVEVEPPAEEPETTMEEPSPSPSPRGAKKAKPVEKKAESQPSSKEKKAEGVKWTVAKVLKDNKITEEMLCLWAKEEFNYGATTLDEIPAVMLKNIAESPEAWVSQFRTWESDRK